MFARSKSEAKRRPSQNRRFQPSSQELEERKVMSWASVPPAAISWSGSYAVGFNSNGAQGRNTIVGSENNMYGFVAPRSGYYTFDAGRATGSNIDTVIGLFDPQGRRLASNDDSNGTTNSRLVVYLNQGEWRFLGVSNYAGRSNGTYNWSIQGPPLSTQVVNNGRGDLFTSGDASLVGNTLTLRIRAATNTTRATVYNHTIYAQLIDRNNNPIGTGFWSRSVQTGGFWNFGYTGTYANRTWTVDVSNFDLRNLSYIRVWAG